MINGRMIGFAVLPAVAAGISLSAMALLLIMIIIFSVPSFLRGGTENVFSWIWRPYNGEFGILPMVVGSAMLSFSTLLLAWPLAILFCCPLLASPSITIRRFLKMIASLMTAVPTVVYGFAAVFLITPLVRESLGGSGFCWLSACLVMTLLVLPTMILILESGLAPRLEELCPGGLALGLNKLDLLWFFVFPKAGKLFLASALLGFGRAMGDTLLPLMLAGNAPQSPAALTSGLRTLTAHMALVTANDVGGAAYDSLFATGALLLMINAATSLALRRLRGTLSTRSVI